MVVKMKMLAVAFAAFATCGAVMAQEASPAAPAAPAAAAPAAQPAMEKVTRELKKRVYGAAAADSISTYIGLASGGAEANPLVNTSPAGLLFMAGVKIAIAEAINRSSWAEIEKASFNNTASAMWTGVSVNNLLVAASASPAVAIGGGVVVGYLLWRHGSKMIATAERERIFWEEGCPSIRQYSGNPNLECVYTPLEPEEKAAKVAPSAGDASTPFEAP